MEEPLIAFAHNRFELKFNVTYTYNCSAALISVLINTYVEVLNLRITGHSAIQC